MRNIFAHNYFEMDIIKIWDVATNDIPVLMKFCGSVLNEIDNQLTSEIHAQDEAVHKIVKPEKITLDERLKQARETRENQPPQKQTSFKSSDRDDR